MRTLAITLAVVLASALHAGSPPAKNDRVGMVSVGGRSSISLFNGAANNSAGTGVGGQFRIRIADRVNTDWFYDYFRSSIGDYAHRQDQHVGWSVLFYLRDPVLSGAEGRQFIQPYLLAGHCFDYTKQQANNDPGNFAERWSSAAQAGLGTHFNLTDRMDLSLVGQYMIHLGTDVHAEREDDEVVFHKERGSSLEGHLLFHVSFNFKLFHAW
ncbi:MAG: hypothetical protein IPI81_07390 [Flavobacteriales bacterium]|nr:hypothetical protein [Flavobacteriales bacterium]MCC6938144.1 hypothetical protein [Flavobacteriales bacterium]